METVTVVIPAYNYETYLLRAIKSVQAQSRKADRIIVVNDCSTDGTKDLLAKIDGIDVINMEENSGVGVCMNTALAEIDTDCLVQLDADDRLLPRYLSETLCHMSENVPMVYTDLLSELIHEDGFTKQHIEQQAPDFNWENLQKFNYIPATVLLNTRIVREVGGWTEGISHHEDYSLFLKLGKAACEDHICSEPKHVQGILWIYTIHRDSKSKACGQDEMEQHLAFIRMNWRRDFEGVIKW